MKVKILCGILIASLWGLVGCGTAGKDFNEGQASKIVPGQTTKLEVLKLLGKPFKKGMQNDKEIWVYEYNEYRALGEDTSKDIFVTFDHKDIVESSQLMTSKGSS